MLVLPTAATEVQPVPIEEARFLPLGGIQQWITIRGADRVKPILLILHGGPGEAQSPLVSTYAPLENNFVVVQWDQRGAGKTLEHAGSAKQSVSLQLLIRDGIELTQYIKQYLHTKSVILVGHSWGSFLGVHIVKERPELFTAFVGTGQIVSWNEMVTTQYRYTLDRARAESNTAAVTELEALGIPASDNFDQYLLMRKWLNRYLAKPDMEWLSKEDELVRSVLTANELRAYRQGFRTMTGLSSTVFSMDLRKIGYEFRLPFFVIQGSDDHITPTSLAADYFEKIRAPKKRMTVIDGAGHFAAMTHIEKFAIDLSQNVLLSR